jgi:hypothetical protein
MSNPANPRKPPPSLWAVGLLFLSAAFALISVLLLSTDYSPF